MMDLPGNSAPDLYFVVVDQEVASRRTKPDSSEVLGTSGDVRGAVDVAMSKLDGLGQKKVWDEAGDRRALAKRSERVDRWWPRVSG